MQKLRLSKFKAFKDELLIPFANKNLLLYGENGAGKSSLYESIKVIFYHQKLVEHISAPTPEELAQRKNDFWSNYNNKIDNHDFEIEINDDQYNSFDTELYRVFMISLEEMKIGNKIHLKEIIENFFFRIDGIDSLCAEGFLLVQDDVNNKLKSFNESVAIEIDNEDDYAIKIIDTNKNVESKVEIKKFFNEAKLNTIVLLLLLSFIELSKTPDKKNILVLDDFITSLDASNRTFLIKHILENFQNDQVLIFTHNISFYNLVMFMINKERSLANTWLFANLYEINNCHRIYFKNAIDRTKAIREDYNNIVTPGTSSEIEAIGNRIRRKFEILLYEYSKLLMVGAVEDSNKIIDRIMYGKSAYYNSKKTASDLVDNLQSIIDENNPNNLSGRLQSEINNFKKHDFDNFQKIIKDLKLYQKITMHPLSHGVIGMPTFTTREIEISFELLEKMEEFLKDMVDTNVSTI
ncbi:hypothetical protein [Sphingobacterium spiritivorum]|uniref:hypothetical protein n=1 Tax=Sphingobacterium spiritivorum TaxID=258 RepID=UPI003DA3DA7D